MAKKKNITESNLIDFYMDYVLEHGKAPHSVYKFAKDNNFEEASFYAHFGTFKALEQKIFTAFLHNALNLLAQNEEYQSFDARNKLLSFYYTFFEILTANRSYVLFALGEGNKPINSSKALTKLKSEFSDYIKSLEIETFNIEQEQIEKIQQRTIVETAWLQLLYTMKFWMDDTSAGFEKTDIFIEKSLKTSFDVINTQPLKSVIDFGKFLFKERMQMN
ncbi:TetR family transcriptional regulator C-terminal domain-containing protein [Paucihalobacter sp.]|uniref:TetR family transcriptional regulator C-terminal domain-containing protein n=1 Tax=Paucihalobacter sp. TaxID=2850405 RepID=UPI002FDF4BC3